MLIFVLCYSKMWSRDLVDAELDALVSAFKAKGIARVSYKRAMSCVSLICNVEKTSQILERVRPAQLSDINQTSATLARAHLEALQMLGQSCVHVQRS